MATDYSAGLCQFKPIISHATINLGIPHVSSHWHRYFDDRVVIVTGATSGIGRATAAALTRSTAKLTITGRDASRLRQTEQSLEPLAPNRILAVPCDVSQRDMVDNLMARTVERFGRIDVLINNAGIGIVGPIEDVQPADAARLFNTNFFGTFHCCQAVLPHFKRQRSGHIVNVASVAGLHGMPNGIYSASKAAIISLSETLRLETQHLGVTITVICPGRVRLTDTAFFDNATRYGPLELSRAPADLTADSVAITLLSAASQQKRLVVFPLHARLLHWLDKFAPTLVDQLLLRHMPQHHDHHAPPAH
jgi:NAD(P)-dependent dehydrogenase (short-subunit alcohol dehydrogenase family)